MMNTDETKTEYIEETCNILGCDIVIKKYTLENTNNNSNNELKFIDLFAGIGGIRKGFELACENLNINSKCVFTSEIKESAINILKQNHPFENIAGDITQIKSEDIPDFDILLAGFPCQAFSSAGKRLGFEDTRGSLFFEVARILKDKKPKGFILENVEGLVNHDNGKTFKIILNTLNELNYKIEWKVLNAKSFGVPQERKRVYIIGSLYAKPEISIPFIEKKKLKDIIENNKPISKTPFVDLLLKHYDLYSLNGKSIKDKRGGSENIHSWDIELKGPVSKEEKNLLNLLLKERRKKKWAEEIGIEWMDGMPLTEKQIQSFCKYENLTEMLDELCKKGYLKKEHPKQKIGNKRVQDINLPQGYNIVAGKMSFEINEILDLNGYAPTLVAMDMQHLYVIDNGLRPLTLREGLRLFGYPEDFKFNINEKEGYDLLGNTVVVPVIKNVSMCLIKSLGENL